MGIAMLLGRFGYVLPVLAMAGAMAAKPKLAAHRRHLAHRRAAVRRPADRRDPDHGRPAVLPRPGARPDRRALPGAGRRGRPLTSPGAEPMTDVAVHLGEKRRSAVAAPPCPPASCARDPDSFVKLDPRKLTGNPVILATEVVALLATISTIDAFRTGAEPWWAFQIALWLWFTVVFANFAESIAEGPRQGGRRRPARPAGRREGQADHRRRSRDRSCRRRPTSWPSATWCWSRPATSSPPTARSSRASPRSTRRRSPASRRR